MFYLAQFFGAIGLIFLLISFNINNKDKLLKYQIFSSSFFSIQYLCLNAITGCLMNLLSLIRNIIFKKYNNNIPIIYLLLMIFSMVVLTVFFYDGIISLLPAIAVSVYSIGLWQKNLTVIRLLELISCILFIIYNINVVAITGLISTIIELSIVLVAVYRYDFKKIGNKENI